MNSCAACGQSMESGARFCGHCGEENSASSVATASPSARARARANVPAAPARNFGTPVSLTEPPRRSTHNLAVASFACSLASWFVVPILGAVAGIVLGHMARAQMRLSPGVYEGEGFALVGLIFGYAQLALACVGLGVAVLLLGGFVALWSQLTQ